MGSLPVFVDLESRWIPSHERRKRSNRILKTGDGIIQANLEKEQFSTFGSNNCP